MKYDEKFITTCIKLGQNIRNKRENRQTTIKELSKITGIRKEYLNKIELGTAYGVMMEKHLLKISVALNVKLSDLFNFH